MPTICNFISTNFAIRERNGKWLSSRQCTVTSVTSNTNPIQSNLTTPSMIILSSQLEEVKYFGLTIRQDLKWKSHVHNISTKINETFGILCRNLNISSTSIKKQAYKSLTRQSLEYACSALDPYNKGEIGQIEKI